MREIKFNFWDKENKVMYKNRAELAICATGGVSELIGHDDYLEWRGTAYSKHIIPLQYTGAIDKNGVEIYEGDIFHLGDMNIKYKVVWSDCGLIGKQIRSSSSIGLEHWKDRIDVIGNIYINPELLEVKK